MDLIPTKFLEAMKNGRAHPHEIRSMAAELIKRRDGKDVVQGDEDTLLIKIPHAAIEGGTWRSPAITLARLLPGDWDLIKFSPGPGTSMYCIVYRFK